MTLLSQVKRGKIAVPRLVLIYGSDGVGKSSFGADAPKPVFLGTEDGTANLDVARFPAPKTFDDVIHAVKELTNEKHEFETLVIDSLDWLEPLVWAKACQDNSWKTIEDPGYGKGFVYANRLWLQLMEALKELRSKQKLNIILIAHSHVKPYNDPAQPVPYDRHVLKLNDKAAALWREFVDCVLFATFEVFVKKEGQKGRAFGEGARIIHTERRPGFDAKNRMNLPTQLPLSWEEFTKACDKGQPDDLENLRKNICELLAQVTDPTVKEKATKAAEEAAKDAAKLARIQDKLRSIVSAA